ncbi:MAG: Lrp/AsnC family transcriptional regulator [Betaproteobacteria bacterium]|nr:MAG: Lrp/AsnC family transcriptional regulator [Betaproteobacteria bacterium]
MNALDEKIVRATQAGLPLTAEPYAEIAKELGVSEQELLSRLQAMLADGRIRRIGAVPNHYALGYAANAMSVWNVADAAIDRLGAAVGALAFVSHCYRRPRRLPDWPYNLFAMVHGRNRAETQRHVEAIKEVLGDALNGFDTLYSLRILKKTGLRF